MEFEWDQDKSDACFTERGFDFAYMLSAFMDADRLIGHTLGLRSRSLSVAWSHRQASFLVAYTIRGTVVRISSARKADQREVSDYENSKRKN